MTATTDSPRKTDRVEACVLAVLLALIPLRAFIQETHTLETPRLARMLDAPAGPTPVTSLLITVVVVASAAAVTASRLWRGKPFCRTGYLPGAALVVAGIVVSTVRAGQQRIALTAGIDFVGVLLFGWLMCQLLRHPWQVRLALCVCLAAGATVAVKCLLQVYDEYPATIEHFEKQVRPQLATQPGGDAGRMYDFERRMRSMAATGYFAHANVAATYLATVLAAAVALAISRRRAGLPNLSITAPMMAAGLCAVALWLTQSRGAIASIVAIAATVASCAAVWQRWRPPPRRMLLLVWSAALGLAVAVVGYGLATGGLPSRSMLFRWMYWRGAAAMVEDQGVWGVGSEQFGRHFARYKLAECPEEVSDPHGWLVRAAAEWGWLGAAGLLLLWVGVSRQLVISQSPRAESSTMQRPLSVRRTSDLSSPPRMVPWIVGIGLIVSIGFWAVSAPNEQTQGALAYAASVVALAMLVWWPAMALLSVESGVIDRFPSRPLPLLEWGLAAAAAVFLLHASIDLALFQPGPATLLLTLLACVSGARDSTDLAGEEFARGAGVRPDAEPTARRRAAVGLGLLGAFSIGMLIYGCILPIHGAARALGAGRSTLAQNKSDSLPRTIGLLEAAAAADRLDATALQELLETVLDRADLAVVTPEMLPVREWLTALRRRDPANSAVDALEARYHLREYDRSGSPDALSQTVKALRRWTAAYPTSPQRHIELGRLLERMAESTNDPLLRGEAAREYRVALDLDERRVYVSEPNRMPPLLRTELGRRIESLEP